MDTINVNYKDVQFLIGCTTSEAKKAIFNALREPDKRLYRSGGVNSRVTVDIRSISLKINSFSDSMHNKNIVEYTVNKIREKGLPDNLKREILEDSRNILRGCLSGKYTILKKILSREQIDLLTKSLERRRLDFLMSGNKVPKALERYVTLEDREKVKLIDTACNQFENN